MKTVLLFIGLLLVGCANKVKPQPEPEVDSTWYRSTYFYHSLPDSFMSDSFTYGNRGQQVILKDYDSMLFDNVVSGGIYLDGCGKTYIDEDGTEWVYTIW